MASGKEKIISFNVNGLSKCSKILSKIKKNRNSVLICRGDLNILLQPKLDTSSGETHGKKSIFKRITILFEEDGLSDIWRDLHPNRGYYSHNSSPHLLYTRLDFFITSGEDKDKIYTCEIEATILVTMQLYLFI